jgi:hypothetical protein
MWLRTVDSLDHNMGLWCEPQSHASFAGLEAEAARLRTRPLVCRCYIQWLCNTRAACGTYVVFGCILLYQNKWLLFYILSLFSQL